MSSPNDYLQSLQRQERTRTTSYPQPIPYQGPYGGMSFDERRNKLVHEAIVQSEIEMRLMMEAEERDLNAHSANTSTSVGSQGGEAGQGTQQQNYLSNIRNTYPTAVLAETFGTKTLNFINSTFGYAPSNVLVAESICSDDIDAPAFGSNIGQFPNSLTKALNPFLAGGLAGYPHTGITGLAAWISHVPASGALFLYSAPHIGVSTDGTVGAVKRRGQGGVLSSTCGAVNAAIATVLGGWTPSLSAVTPLSAAFGKAPVYYDYQQNTLTGILYNNLAALTAAPASQQMAVGTEAIRVASRNWIKNNLATSYAAVSGGGVGTPDVYLATGTFINTDDGYNAFMQVNTFEKFSYSTGWTDQTTAYLATITP